MIIDIYRHGKPLPTVIMFMVPLPIRAVPIALVLVICAGEPLAEWCAGVCLLV